MDNLKIVYKTVQSLVPYANNARVHTESQVELIARSIQEFGFNNPVLIDEHGTVVAGHGRVMAANKLGLSKVPCIVLAHLSERQRKAYIIADNKIALRSSWDMEKLSVELSDLSELGMDLELTGFDEGELDSILRADIILPTFTTAPEPAKQLEEVTAPAAPKPSAPAPAAPETFADANREIAIEQLPTVMTLNLKYEEAEYWKIKNRLSEIAETPEDALRILIERYDAQIQVPVEPIG